MNEVTRIHLGRQSYTISVAAHKSLKQYLDAIEKKVADEDVVDEVELRMAELLAERGVTGDKVILVKDVTFLKEQLGSPDDFSEDATDSVEQATEDKPTKRLFRDTTNAYVAGVAAGIASYFGVDVLLVRLLFVILTFFGGGIGIVIYILFWLVVPPAETASEKLQMQGKPVTLEALKASVDKADVAGAARRANETLLRIINAALRVGVVVAGIGFLCVGIGLFVGIATMKIYMFLHDGQLFQENIFPVGLREQWLVNLVCISLGVVALFLLLIGVATFQRKWPVRSWITMLLVGVFIVSSTGAMALGVDAAPRIKQRYEASLHTTAIKDIKPFNKVVTTGDIDISYIPSATNGVNVHYSGNPDLSKLKVTVENNTLYVDSTALDQVQHCTMLCLFPRYNMTVEVYAPNIEDFKTPRTTDIFYPPVPSLPGGQ